MADITNELQTISANRYGDDVRFSIHDSIEKINSESSESEELAVSGEESISNLLSDSSKLNDSVKENVDAAKKQTNYISDLYKSIGEYPKDFSIDDENGDPIMDENGDPIMGEIIFLIKQ